MRTTIAILLAMFLVLQYMSCKKYLDATTDQKKIIPSKVEDLQAILNNEQVLNQKSPKAMDLSADEFFLTDNDWAALEECNRRMYVWEKGQMFEKGSNNDWGNIYTNVYLANTVLAYANEIEGRPDDIKNVKGQALFLRAQAFLQATFIWTTMYDERTAGTDPGIPLRLTPDMNEKTVRATLKQTYERIIDDLKLAAELLPMQPVPSLRPSKPATYAVLARCYMSMGDYRNMGAYADLCLQFRNTLIDYNTLDQNPTVQLPFAPRFSNAEIITGSSVMATQAFNIHTAKVNPELYNSYSNNDLRKWILFKDNQNGTFSFRGNYSGTVSLYSGISTNEVYLMRAEYYAREGIKHAAMADLNKLLEKRFVAGTFVQLTARNPAEALDLILKERRKELVLRGLRWIDLKRLNKAGANIELKRLVNGRTYRLPPNDRRYALQIPEDEIKMSGMVQNP